MAGQAGHYVSSKRQRQDDPISTSRFVRRAQHMRRTKTPLTVSFGLSRRPQAVSLGVVKYARVVRVVGLAFTGYDLSVATDQSIHLKSIRPLEKEVIRQTGGWAGSWAGAVAGARVGASVGAMVGIELGPGAVITGAIGGILFGAIGYFGGSMIANEIADQ